MFEVVNRVCVHCHQDFRQFKSVKSNDVMRICTDCKPNKLNFIAVETVNLKNYKVNGGNVSKSRIDMIKSRRMHPDGNGEVVLTKNGKITDRLAQNY